MSIDNYTELQAALANWLRRDDLVARVPELIELFESTVRRELRVRQMESRSTADTVASQRALALPSDFLETRTLHMNSSPRRQLIWMPPNQLTLQFAETPSIPQAYTVVGSEYLFGPIPDAVYEIEADYYAFTELSSGAPTNWLLTAAPDAYLFGSLAQVDDERARSWATRALMALEQLKQEDFGARFNGTPLAARPDFVTP